MSSIDWWAVGWGAAKVIYALLLLLALETIGSRLSNIADIADRISER